jgi:hypothetical protein
LKLDWLAGPPTPPPELVVDDSVKTETVPAVAVATFDSAPPTSIAGEAATSSQAQPLPTIISDGGGPGYGAVTTPGAASPLSTSFITSPSAENRKPRMSDLLNPTTTTTMAVVAPVAAAAPSPTPASAAIGQPVPQVDVSMPAGAAPAPVPSAPARCHPSANPSRGAGACPGRCQRRRHRRRCAHRAARQLSGSSLATVPVHRLAQRLPRFATRPRPRPSLCPLFDLLHSLRMPSARAFPLRGLCTTFLHRIATLSPGPFARTHDRPNPPHA